MKQALVILAFSVSLAACNYESETQDLPSPQIQDANDLSELDGRFKKLLKKAEQGNAKAQCSLGLKYVKGVDVIEDHKRSQRIYILPNLSFMLSMAGPIVYLFARYLCNSVLMGSLTKRWQSWNLMVMTTWSLICVGILLTIVALINSYQKEDRTGRKRYWLAITVCVLFSVGVCFAYLLDEWAGSIMACWHPTA